MQWTRAQVWESSDLDPLPLIYSAILGKSFLPLHASVSLLINMDIDISFYSATPLKSINDISRSSQVT